MAGTRKSETILRANDKKLNADLRRSRRKFKKFGKGVEKDLKKSFGGVKRTIGTLAGFAGVAGVASLGRDVLSFEKSLKRLEIQAGKDNLKLGEFRDQITGVSNATGQSRNALVGASAKFVSLTGNAKVAKEQLGLFAKVSTATGTDIEAVAATAASLQDNLKLKPEEFEQAFDTLIAQGKAGAIELSDLARIMSGVAPTFKQFGNDGAAGLAELGAAFQAVKKDFGTPEEAAVGLRGLLLSLNKAASDLKIDRFTVDTETGEKRLKNFTELVSEIGDLGLDPVAFQKAFGKQGAQRAFKAIQGNIDLFEDLKKTQKFAGTTAKDFADFQASSAGRISTAWAQVQNTFAKVLTPERITKLATAFEGLAKLVGFLVDNLDSIVALAVGGKLLSIGAQLSTASAGANKLSGGLAAATGKATKLFAAFSVGFAAGGSLDKLTGGELSRGLANLFGAGIQENFEKGATGDFRRLNQQADQAEELANTQTGQNKAANLARAAQLRAQAKQGIQSVQLRREKITRLSGTALAQRGGSIARNALSAAVAQRGGDPKAESAKLAAAIAASPAIQKQIASLARSQALESVGEGEGISFKQFKALVDVLVSVDDKGEIVTKTKTKRGKRNSR